MIDEYTLFYLNWIEPIKDTLQEHSPETGYWQGTQQSAAWHTWSGYAFEAVCFKHLAAIRRKLQIPPTAIAGSSRYSPEKHSKEEGAQIDLLFDRRDGVVTLCEIKYSAKPFTIDKQYAKSLQAKARIFAEKTNVKKQMMTAIVAAGGLTENLYSEI